MKKSWKWVLCLALAVTMLCCTALAAEVPEIAYGAGMSAGSITVAADDTVTVTVPAAMVKDGEQYVVILVKAQGDTAQALLSASYELGEDTILCIDQYAATASGLTFTGKPRSMSSCVVLLGGKDGSGQATPARVLGAIKTQGVTITGTVTAKGATAATEVKVEALNASGTKLAETSVTTAANGTGTYTLDGVPAEAVKLKVSTAAKYVAREYPITADTTEQNVEICPKGDATLDGNLMINDVNAVYRHLRPTGTKLTDYKLSCGKVKGDGAITIADVNAIYKHVRDTEKLW